MLADELGHRPGYQGDPEPLPDERGEVVSRQGIEAKLLGIGRLAEPLVVLRDGFGERTQGEHQQRRWDPLGDEPGQGPGSRVAPVSVLNHDQQRPLPRGHLERADQKPAGVVPADLALQLTDELIVGEVEQHVAEQRRQALKSGRSRSHSSTRCAECWAG